MKLFDVHVINPEGSLVAIFSNVAELTLVQQSNELFDANKNLIGVVPGSFILKLSYKNANV